MEVASASKFYLETPTGEIVPLTENGKAVNFRFPPGDPTSKIHFVIKHNGRGHILKNLGMEGSIFVNGRPVCQEIPLSPWDSLEAAGHSARYHEAGVPQRMTTTVLVEETVKAEEESVVPEAERRSAPVPFPEEPSQPATVPFPEAPPKSESVSPPKTKKANVAGFPVPKPTMPSAKLQEENKLPTPELPKLPTPELPSENKLSAPEIPKLPTPEFPKEVELTSSRPTSPITSNAFDGLFEDSYDSPRSKGKTAVWTGVAVAAVLLVASIAGLAVRSNSGESQSQITSEPAVSAEELLQRMSQPMSDEEPIFNKVQKNR